MGLLPADTKAPRAGEHAKHTHVSKASVVSTRRIIVIALKLGITEHTVSNYLFRIYNKLGISSRVELILALMKRPDIHRGAS